VASPLSKNKFCAWIAGSSLLSRGTICVAIRRRERTASACSALSSSCCIPSRGARSAAIGEFTTPSWKVGASWTKIWELEIASPCGVSSVYVTRMSSRRITICVAAISATAGSRLRSACGFSGMPNGAGGGCTRMTGTMPQQSMAWMHAPANSAQ